MLAVALSSSTGYHVHARGPAARGGQVRCCTASPGSDRDAIANALERVVALDAEVLPQSYFEEINYGCETPVPWDLFGQPQPCVRNAARDGSFGPAGTTILDCGCGAGDNANWLASRGYDVLGFDFSPSAVATARERRGGDEVASAIAATSGAAEYVQASAVDLGAAKEVQARARELGGFEVALDSALLHCLDDASQRAYLDGLRGLVRPGGRLFIGCFSDANPDPWLNPRRMSEAQLRALLTNERGWRLASLTQAWYQRPSGRTNSSGGAWTMAWWCCAEACVRQDGQSGSLGSGHSWPPRGLIRLHLEGLGCPPTPWHLRRRPPRSRHVRCA